MKSRRALQSALPYPQRTHTPCFTLLVVLGAALLAALPVAAQDDAPRETFTGRAQVTAVDLVIDVRDADGRVPADLGPEDFRVLEDGEEKQVVGVELLAGGTVAGSTAQRSTAVAPPSDDAALDEATWGVVIYVDQVLSSTRSIRRATEVLSAQAGRLASLGAVEVIVADPQPRQLLPPTRSARLIEQTLLRLGRETSGRDAIRQLRRQFFEHLRRQTELVGRGQGSTSAASGIDLSRTGLNTGRTTFTWEAVRQEHRLLVGQQDAMLTWVSSHLGSGPRALMLVNDGYDLDPRDFYSAGVEGSRMTAEINSTLQDYSPQDQFQEMARSIAAAGWTCVNLAFGSLDATFNTASAEVDGKGRMGVISGATGELASALPTQLATRPLDPLRNLADETGGELVTGASGIPAALERLGERVRLTYQVARLPDGEVHRVQVIPRDDSWKVKTPEWSGSPAPQAASSARARRLIAGGVEAGGLPLEAAVGIDEATPAEGEGDELVRGTLQARLELREMTAALP
ncbi:MAG TPA: hypothetical protein VKU40_08090, partial [Thermoanaerobaculia bacterium]|nr:hypothetical protein [Thermoanaerobaculia bacterium]